MHLDGVERKLEGPTTLEIGSERVVGRAVLDISAKAFGIDHEGREAELAEDAVQLEIELVFTRVAGPRGSSLMPPGRYEHRFAESEASSILQRAADLQRQASDVRRMTVAELEDAAASAGIEPVYVRRAAAELSLRQARRDRFSPTIGGPRTILLEVTLDGEIPVPAYEYVIEAVRRHTGELGVASLIGRSLTWTALPGHSRAGPGWSRTIAVTIVPRGGRTRIRIEEKLDQLVRSVFTTSLLGVGGASSLLPMISLAVMGLPALIPLGLGLWLGGAWSIARRIYRDRVAAREQELHGALQAIMEIAEDYMAQRRLRQG